jgi:hypothetical protein
MRDIRVTVETEEFERLVIKKKDQTWHDFVMTLAD